MSNSIRVVTQPQRVDLSVSESGDVRIDVTEQGDVQVQVTEAFTEITNNIYNAGAIVHIFYADGEYTAPAGAQSGRAILIGGGGGGGAGRCSDVVFSGGGGGSICCCSKISPRLCSSDSPASRPLAWRSIALTTTRTVGFPRRPAVIR